jgi:hypothetical protein
MHFVCVHDQNWGDCVKHGLHNFPKQANPWISMGKSIHALRRRTTQMFLGILAAIDGASLAKTKPRGAKTT